MNRITTEWVGMVVGIGKKREVSDKETVWYLIADFTEEKCGSGGQDFNLVYPTKSGDGAKKTPNQRGFN